MLSFAGRSTSELTTGYSVDVDARAGSAGLRLPVPAPPGRSGLAPSLALQYSSGAGNSAFGSGWSLSGLPVVGLDTRLNVPHWDGSDGFALNGDPLVPWLEQQAGVWVPRGLTDGTWSVAYFRSQRRNDLVRIEKWVHRATGRVHFRTRDPNNLLTIFGARPQAAARIADPQDESRTLAWLPEIIVDPHGNALWFEYAAETGDGVERAAPFERLQLPLAQRYLKRVRYGNTNPLTVEDKALNGVLPNTRWCFQLVLDYGDHQAGRSAGCVTGPSVARSGGSLFKLT